FRTNSIMISIQRRNARMHRLGLTAALVCIGAAVSCSDSTSPPGTGNVSGFSIEVRFVGTAPSPAVQAAFTAAAHRLSQVITGALTQIDATQLSAATLCGDSTLPVIGSIVQNIVIYAKFGPIDGAGGVLGQSGPCGIRTSTSLPFVGVMKFDSVDLAPAVASGSINAIVLHEMQHVLGFGTLWSGPPDFPT